MTDFYQVIYTDAHTHTHKHHFCLTALLFHVYIRNSRIQRITTEKSLERWVGYLQGAFTDTSESSEDRQFKLQTATLTTFRHCAQYLYQHNSCHGCTFKAA